MKIEAFKISVACKDDVRREDLAATMTGLAERLADTTYVYGVEVDDDARKAPDVLEIAARPADPPKKRRGRRTKAEILAAKAGRGELKAVERRGQVPAGANAPAHGGTVPAV